MLREPDLRADLAKERRLLMITSVVLLLVQVAGLRLERISILGNTFQVEYPGLLPLIAWVLWGYFGLRYYQVYRDLNDTGPEAAREEHRKRYLVARGKRQFESSFRARGSSATPITFSYSRAFAGFDGSYVVVLDGHALTTASDGQPQSHAFSNHEVRISPPNQWERMRAWWWVALHTRYATEYLLPFLVAALPVLLGVASAAGIETSLFSRLTAPAP